VAIGVPKAAEWQGVENFKQYVVFTKRYVMMNRLPSRILREEMKKLEDLTRKSLATRILDHEEYKQMIGQIFQRVNDATTSFQVRTLIFIEGCVLLIAPSQVGMAISIQNTASQIHDDTKVGA